MAKKIGKIASPKSRKKSVSQADIPAYSLVEALRVPRAVIENFGNQPPRPIAVAQAMSIAPGSGPFKMLCGASIAFGLTEGGYNAAQIVVTPLGRRILRPTVEGDDAAARREATLRPRVLGEFLRRYDGNRFPRPDIAQNVLAEMGVSRDATPRVLKMITDSAQAVGFIRDINESSYVDLVGTADPASNAENGHDDALHAADDSLDSNSIPGDASEIAVSKSLALASMPLETSLLSPSRENRRVFITHGKNRAIVPHLRSLLEFGQFEPVVSVDRESVSKPVPDKVMDDLRACGAAIIHVDAEEELINAAGEKTIVLNPNVLIEIGAAMALYGRRFILLVKDGVRLPSNLQGLYEVRYSGDQLDGDATLKLLRAFNDFKNYLPK